MVKTSLKQPLLILLYGFPGAGKTHFARKICTTLQATHIDADRIRNELFEKPRYDKAEDTVVMHLMEYMAEEFLKVGVSVVFDTDVRKTAYRRHLREIAKKQHSDTLLLWFQIDTEAAFSRLASRDRRKGENKFARELSRTDFDAYATSMQHPQDTENYIVLSGKHSFLMQYSSLLRRLFDMNLITAEDVSAHVVKPGLMNLVPGHRDFGRQNIHIRS